MWYFQLVADPERKFLLLPGKEYMLGRRDCDIVIENDQTVSRKHAILKVTHPESNVQHPNKPSKLTLTDISKFGTHVNGERMHGERDLKDGDEVLFGSPKSIHRVVYRPFIVTTSLLDSPGKKEVRALMSKMGGHIASEWQKDCSYLVMKNITVTVKVICALVSQKNIITPAFLQEYFNHLKEEADKPDPAAYLPPITERLSNPDVSFLPKPERSCVFLGMSFYFLCSKQFWKMNMVVELGGGVPILCDDPGSIDLETLIEDKTVVMAAPAGGAQNNKQKQWIEKVVNYVTRNKKRTIQDSELGYSVLYCSTTDYCNPNKDVSHLLSQPLASQTMSQVSGLMSQSQMSAVKDEHHLQQQFNRPAEKMVHCVGEASKTVETVGSHSSYREKDVMSMSLTAPDGESASQVFPNLHKGSIKEEPLVTDTDRKKLASSLSDKPSSLPFDAVHPDKGKPRQQKQTKQTRSGVSAQEEDVVTNTRQTRSRSPAPESDADTDVRQTRSRSRSPAPQDGVVKNTRQTRSRSPAPDTLVSLSGTQSRSQAAKPAPAAAKSRSPVGRQLLVPDSEVSPGSSKHGTRENSGRVKVETEVAVKQEKDTSSRIQTVSAAQSVLDSECLFDSAVVKTEPATHLKFLDDSDDEVISAKPAPKTKKRRRDVSTDDDENPFDFVEKRPKKSRSPSPSPTPTSESPRSRNSGSEGGNRGIKQRDVSPGSGDDLGFEDIEDLKPKGQMSSSVKDKVLPSAQSVKGRASPPPIDTPVPRGFFTTRTPLEDQVEVNMRFERESIETSAMNVQFATLIKRQHRENNGVEDQTDVPQGMMRWKGKLVPNFKNFRKTAHAGAGQLPRIIGGRDLEEHRKESKKELDNWLKEMQRAESQNSQQDREALELFNYQPTTSRSKSRR